MDIARPSIARKKKIRRIVLSVTGLVAVALVTVALARLKPAAPTVEYSSLWPDTVKRGSMLRQVRGPGTLVPEDIRWITAATDATVQRIVTLPSPNPLPADTVILELRDERVQQEMLDAELQLRAAEADLTSLEVRLNNELLQQQSEAANIRGQFHEAKIQAEANEQLSKEGLLSNVTTRVSRVQADELEKRNALEEERLKIRAQSTAAQMKAEQARVDQRKALYDLKRSQAEALKVRAGIEGVLQVVPVQVGQRVPAGTNLARVAVPGKLKAELRIPETQARDIEIGLRGHRRYAEWRGRRACFPNGSGGTERNRARGRQIHSAPAARRATGSERGRHDRTRAAGKRPLCWAPGVRPGERNGQLVQAVGSLRAA